MSIGYACLTVGVPNTDIKSCMLKNADDKKLAQLIEHNLSSLRNMIDYNKTNKINLFRISSDIIPFGSSPVNTLPWTQLFKQELTEIGETVKKAGIRVSMHPGQYTVLNSPDSQVADRAVEDLNYHASFLDSLGVDYTHKIILHIGGVYGDKRAAIRRFADRYRSLSPSVRDRLVIENDDKSYHICDVLELGTALGIPVVYDNLHNKLNCCDSSKDDLYWVTQSGLTWKQKDGKQKIHYSQQNPVKNAGSHSESILIDDFLHFYQSLGQYKPDIMLEVKDKNISAIKCTHCTSESKDIKVLELEWSRYKYAVLEKSPNDYKMIRELLKDKNSYPALAFYNIIEHAYRQEVVQGNSVNAILHIWGYFKNLAGAAEKKRFFDLLQIYQEKNTSIISIKRFLYRLAEKYRQDYLLRSYYFL